MLHKLLSDPLGNLSSTRLGFLVVVGVFMGVWAYLSVKNNQMQTVDTDQLFVLLGSFGFKVYQKSLERE